MNLAQKIVEALQRGGYLIPEVKNEETVEVVELVQMIIEEDKLDISEFAHG